MTYHFIFVSLTTNCVHKLPTISEDMESMAKRWDPHKGRWTMRQLINEKLRESYPDGLPIRELSTMLKQAGYHIPSLQYLVNMLPSLKLTMDPDGNRVRLK